MGDVSIDVLEERLRNFKEDIAQKHAQNRNDIHSLRNDVQTLSNSVWLLKLKIVGYASGSGVLTGILLKLLDHFWKQ